MQLPRGRSAIERLALWLHAHARAVLVLTLVGATLAAAAGISVAEKLTPYSADDPTTESVRARESFENAKRRQITPGIVAVVRTGASVERSRIAERHVRRFARQLAHEPDIAEVVTFYDSFAPALVSRDGTSTVVMAYFRNRSAKRITSSARAISQTFADRTDVTLGGPAIADAQVNEVTSREGTRAELLAFPLIALLSLLFFRSVVAAALPPLLGALAIAGTFFVLTVISRSVDISIFALNLVTGAGLGLAIDYSLFVVSRYREEAANLGYGPEALARTLATAGRTVLFSSITVAISVASLMLFPQQFLFSMGLGGAVVALLAASLALTVLPAMLAVLGPRVNALAPAWLQRAAERDARPASSGAWFRLSRFVMKRPVPIAALSVGALIAAGLPFLQIKFISVDASALPATSSARQVDDILASDFRTSWTAPINLVIHASATTRAMPAFLDRMRHTKGVTAVTPADPAGRMSLVAIAAKGEPHSDEAQALVRHLRALDAPFPLMVAGQTAAYLDLKASIQSHLPRAIAVVVGATLLILFAMTGSLLLPIKAVIMNALTLSATFGILVAIFQHGHLESLLGFHSQGALEITGPVLLVVVTFGLATDYGVFLLSRIKEAHDAGASNSDAVALGLERTGRIVTAAALLFAVAVGTLVTSQIVFIKELGLGTALAVLIDASIVRALLVPALMAILGSRNWWAPSVLKRLHRRIGFSER